MNQKLVLTGDENIPALPMKESEVNHLRRLLAWIRCEYMLDEHMQAGYLQGAQECVKHGHSTPERAGQLIQEKVELINKVPAYVRQAHKMLTKTLAEHDKKSGVIETGDKQ